LAESDPQGFARINAIGLPEDVHARIMAAIAVLLPENDA